MAQREHSWAGLATAAAAAAGLSVVKISALLVGTGSFPVVGGTSTPPPVSSSQHKPHHTASSAISSGTTTSSRRRRRRALGQSAVDGEGEVSEMPDMEEDRQGGEGDDALPRPKAAAIKWMSFDLDDTVWSTMAVINQANAALDDHLQVAHPEVHANADIGKLMKEVHAEQRASNPELGPAPLNLTALRRGALAKAAESVGMSAEEKDAFVDHSFGLWIEQRHNVEAHIFDGVLDTLDSLKARGIRLCAITNGNADTERIPRLADIFEFCINAERVGARKPDRQPFLAALEKAGYSDVPSVGGLWVHVGDDAFSDCTGAKAVEMKTVLVQVPGNAMVEHHPATREHKDAIDRECRAFADLLGVVDEWEAGTHSET